jgi:hypothetical protein
MTPAPESTLYLGHFEKGQETLRNAVFPLQLEALVQHGWKASTNQEFGPWTGEAERKGGIPAQRFCRGSAEALSR